MAVTVLEVALNRFPFPGPGEAPLNGPIELLTYLMKMDKIDLPDEPAIGIKYTNAFRNFIQVWCVASPLLFATSNIFLTLSRCPQPRQGPCHATRAADAPLARLDPAQSRTSTSRRPGELGTRTRGRLSAHEFLRLQRHSLPLSDFPSAPLRHRLVLFFFSESPIACIRISVRERPSLVGLLFYLQLMHS